MVNGRMIIQVGDVLVEADIITERFCCDLEICKGICCIEGDAGAPVTLDEVEGIEASIEAVWGDLSVAARGVIGRQGVAYTDAEGDLVTSIVGGRDCVFTCREGDCCLCALERAYRRGATGFCKPVSCALYPIREVALSNGLTGLNYHRWGVCSAAIAKGRRLDMPLYRFLRAPLVRRFGAEWYAELERVAGEMRRQGML